MKNLELTQMENVNGGECRGIGWAGFGLVALAGTAVIVSVASGGTLLPVMLTIGGKAATATVTASGFSAMVADCD